MIFCLTQNVITIDYNTDAAGQMNVTGGINATWEAGIVFTVDAAGSTIVDDVSPGQEQTDNQGNPL